MSDNTTPTRATGKLGLKTTEILVGAGTATITAFASSFFGVAGTLTGAAVASVIATICTAVLRTSAERTNESLRWANQRLRGRLTSTLPRSASNPDTTAPPAGRKTATARGLTSAVADLTGGWASVRWLFATRRRALTLGGAVALVFAVTMIGITGVESAIGGPLSSLFGKSSHSGTTLGNAIGTGHAGQKPTAPGNNQTGGPPTTGRAGPTSVRSTGAANPSGGATASPTGPGGTQAPGQIPTQVPTAPATAAANAGTAAASAP